AWLCLLLIRGRMTRRSPCSVKPSQSTSGQGSSNLLVMLSCCSTMPNFYEAGDAQTRQIPTSGRLLLPANAWKEKRTSLCTRCPLMTRRLPQHTFWSVGVIVNPCHKLYCKIAFLLEIFEEISYWTVPSHRERMRAFPAGSKAFALV